MALPRWTIGDEIVFSRRTLRSGSVRVITGTTSGRRGPAIVIASEMPDGGRTSELLLFVESLGALQVAIDAARAGDDDVPGRSTAPSPSGCRLHIWASRGGLLISRVTPSRRYEPARLIDEEIDGLQRAVTWLAGEAAR